MSLLLQLSRRMIFGMFAILLMTQNAMADESFVERFEDFKAAYPKFSEGILPSYYAASSNPLNEFMSCFNEFNVKYPQHTQSLLPSCYAMSQNGLREFMNRFDAFNTAFPRFNVGLLPCNFALTNTSQQVFMSRYLAHKTAHLQAKEIYSSMYVLSSRSVDDYDKRITSFASKYPQYSRRTLPIYFAISAHEL